MNKLPLIAIMSVMAVSFSSAAMAGDGKYMKHKKNMGGKHHMMRLMDANGDGTVSAEEFQAFRGQKFAGADKNGDGRLSAEEFANMARAMKEEREKAYKEAMEKARQEKMQKHFGEMDADGDGIISKAEFDAKGERSFIRMDKNDDGILDKKDRKNMKHKKYGKDMHEKK